MGNQERTAKEAVGKTIGEEEQKDKRTLVIMTQGMTLPRRLQFDLFTVGGKSTNK